MQDITLNSVVLLFDRSKKSKFHKSEILDINQLSRDLMKMKNLESYKKIHQYLIETIKTQLYFGNRIVLVGNLEDNKLRMPLIKILSKIGINIYYILKENTTNKFLLNGDDIAISLSEDFNVISPPSIGNLLNYASQYNGVTAIGDIHGVHNSMKKATTKALDDNNLIIFLGDIIDYGNKPVECIELAYSLVISGKALMVTGNHERKMYRYYNQPKGVNKISINHGNSITIKEIDSLPYHKREIVKSKLFALYNMARNHYVIGKHLFVHAAGHNDMYSEFNYRLKKRELCDLALFGQIDSDEPIVDNYPNRIYDWVDDLSSNKTVTVGHDIRSNTTPLQVIGQNGSKVIFLDTGCGKGGRLSSANYELLGDDLRLVGFLSF